MSVVPWVLAAAGSSLAALAAVADGALLSETSLGAVILDRGVLLAPQPTVPRAIPSRERPHRALALARVIGHLVAGSALALALGLAGRTTPQAVMLLALAGIVTVALAESVARAIGDALGDSAAARLKWFTVGCECLLAPVVRLGEVLDASVEDVVSTTDASVERREEAAAQFREVITSEADVSRDERE